MDQLHRNSHGITTDLLQRIDSIFDLKNKTLS